MADVSDKPDTFLPVSDNGQTVTKVVFSTSTDVRLSYYQQANKLKIGSSYTLTYGVKKLSSVGNCWVRIYLSDNLTDLGNAVVITEFDSKNCSTSYYNEFSVQFTYPESLSGKSTYIVVMLMADKLNSGFQVTDFVFTNNDKSEEKIDGILEWLSAVYHGIVGGEDSRGVQHDGLVQGIKNGISALGDRISAFFDNLGEKFGIDIGSLGDRIRDFFSNFWENVSAGFEAIKDKIADIGEGIKVKFQEISDNFTEFFDKFKPRVYEEFTWSLGSIDVDNTIIEDPYNAYTSESITVDNSSGYYLKFAEGDNEFDIYNLDVHYYLFSGELVGSWSYTPSSEEIYLEPGFKYRISIYTSNCLDELNSYDLSKWCNGKVLVYADEGWINALIHSLLNGLKQLFIPSPGYFDGKLDEFLEAYEDHFGIFAQSTIYFTKAIQKVQSILSDTYAFSFPELSITIQGKKYVFSERQNVDIQQWLKSGTWSANLYEMYRVFASAFLIYLVLLYARKVEAVILNNTPELAEEGLEF